jgi:hypothetical protein
MPIIVQEDGGLTFSAKFDHEAFIWLEHPSLDPAEIGSALGLPAGATRPPRPGEESQALVWMSRVDPGTDPEATLAGVADRLTAAADFLARVRAEGGRYGCLVLCHVDFNAGFDLGDALLRRLGALGIDLTVHTLDVETPETAAGMRRFLEIMNDPPWEKRPVTDPAEEPEPDADDPP